MTKKRARELIYGGAVTVGLLKNCLEMAAESADGSPSRVNPSVPRHYAHVMFTACLVGRDDALVIDGCRGHSPKRDLLIATNILREFGEFAIQATPENRTDR